MSTKTKDSRFSLNFVLYLDENMYFDLKYNTESCMVEWHLQKIDLLTLDM